MKGFFEVVFTLLFLIFCVAEPPCSKYHYEDQILSKVVRLEHRLELLEEKINKGAFTNKACRNCPDRWIQYKGSCYVISEETLPFGEARASCQKLHADLVHIDNTDENTFLRNHLRTLKGSDYWIGLTDAHTEGMFRWVDDHSKASFTDWSPVQPDDGGKREDCAHFKRSFNLKWNDGECHLSFQFICEKKIEILRE